MDIAASALHKAAMGDFLRDMNWLGAHRTLGYLRLLAVMNLAMLAFLLLTSRGGIDRNGFLLGSDFIGFWTTGKMLQDGGNVYDAAAHIAVQRRFHASADGFTAFFYPPSFLPFCWLLGLTGYFVALAGWLLATGAVYVVAIRQWWSRLPLPVPAWLAVAAFPAVCIVITHGQTAFLLAGLLGLAVLLVPTCPLLAGVLFGLATIKPQFGLLVPLALLLTREWKVMVAATFTAVLLAALSAAANGVDSWADWLSASARAQAAMEAGAVPFGKLVTPFAAARLAGLPVDIAYTVQLVATLAIVAGIGLAGRCRRWTAGLGAAILAGAPWATPFALDYDLVLLAFPLIWLAGQGLRNGFGPFEKLAIALAFVSPAFARPIALAAGIPIMPAIGALLFVVVVRRAAADR